MSDCCDGNFFDKFIKPRLAVASGHRDLVDEILDEILFAVDEEPQNVGIILTKQGIPSKRQRLDYLNV